MIEGNTEKSTAGTAAIFSEISRPISGFIKPYAIDSDVVRLCVVHAQN